MKENEEIDHEYTEEITCPYCGYEEGDSWEYQNDSGDTQCGECGEKFHFERNVSVDYTTNKIE